MEQKKNPDLLNAFNTLVVFCDKFEFCSDCPLYCETEICPIDTLKEVSSKGFVKQLEEVSKNE